MLYLFTGIALESFVLLALLNIKELEKLANIMIVTLIIVAIVLGVSTVYRGY
ncbi:MAG: hypothetical protein ACLRVU_01040 [Beduini sp.]|uniref:hypothetical protein n=1 Tax=Beduini sp. TaxID=1922300 RepID=UPI0039A01B34